MMMAEAYKMRTDSGLVTQSLPHNVSHYIWMYLAYCHRGNGSGLFQVLQAARRRHCPQPLLGCDSQEERSVSKQTVDTSRLPTPETCSVEGPSAGSASSGAESPRAAWSPGSASTPRARPRRGSLGTELPVTCSYAD